MKVVIKSHVKGVGRHTPRQIEIDRRVPKKHRPAIIFHERVEHTLMHGLRMKYKKAHRIANNTERKVFFKGKKKEWKAYNKLIHKIDRSEKKRRRRR